MLVRNNNLVEMAKDIFLRDKYLIIRYPINKPTRVLDINNVWEVREQFVNGNSGVLITHGPNLASPDTIKCKHAYPQELIQKVNDRRNQHNWFSYDEISRTSFDIFKLERDEKSHSTSILAFAYSLNSSENSRVIEPRSLQNIKERIPNITRYDNDYFGPDFGSTNVQFSTHDHSPFRIWPLVIPWPMIELNLNIKLKL